MADLHSRRRFIQRSCAALAAVPAVVGLTAAAEPGKPAAAAAKPAVAKAVPAKPEPSDKLTAYQVDAQIWLRWNNAALTSYRAHPTQKYPYFYPLSGPLSGLSLTTESSLPWPHHRSLLFACDHVNGGNYWQGDVKAGQIFSQELKLGAVTPQSAEILDRCQWNKPGEPPIAADQRKFTVTVAGPRLHTIDAEIIWSAVQNVTVTKTNHSLFALRAAPDIIPTAGGTLVNADGKSGEKATFGQKSAWCCYYGKRAACGNLLEGIALFDHPQNPWAPSPWFTRDYGFISPSPFNFLEKPWELAAGKSVHLRYRVVLFAGDPAEAGLEQLYKEWAA